VYSAVAHKYILIRKHVSTVDVKYDKNSADKHNIIFVRSAVLRDAVQVERRRAGPTHIISEITACVYNAICDGHSIGNRACPILVVQVRIGSLYYSPVIGHNDPQIDVITLHVTTYSKILKY